MNSRRLVAADRSVTLFADGVIAGGALRQVGTVARAAGYRVTWAETSDEAADVGIYCLSQAKIREVNANFPVILPRGPGHHAGSWPRFWRDQPWDRFDLGLLPSPYWLHLWRTQGQSIRSRSPRYGAVLSGWPTPPAQATVVTSRPVRLAVALHVHAQLAIEIITHWTSGLHVEVVEWSMQELLGADVGVDGRRLVFPAQSTALSPFGHMPAADFVVTDDGSVLIEAIAAGAIAISLTADTKGVDLRPELGPLGATVQPVGRDALRQWVGDVRTAAARPPGGSRSLTKEFLPSSDAAARIMQNIEEALDPSDVMPAPRAAMRLLPKLRERLAASEALNQQLLRVIPAASLADFKVSFDEETYRARNLDVNEAIERSHVPNGLTHWQAIGQSEGRHGPFKALGSASGPPAPKSDNYHDGAWEGQALRRRCAQAEPRSVRSIVVYSPEYDAMTGGTISLHKLCGMLRQRGVDASMWWPERTSQTVDTSPWMLPNARAVAQPADAIVVYPEVVDGNPLGAPHVVRWLLNYPGKLGSNRHYRASDIVLHIGPFCALDPDPANELCIIHNNDSSHSAEQRLPSLPTSSSDIASAPRRYRGCFSVRKGAARPRVPLTEGCINIDGLSRPAAREVFSMSEYFFSYDQYTFLLLEAAMLGATSVVLPDMAMSASRWRRTFPLASVGVAYGIDEVDWARSTRALIPAHLQRLNSLADFQLDSLLRRLLQAGWWSGELSMQREGARRGAR